MTENDLIDKRLTLVERQITDIQTQALNEKKDKSSTTKQAQEIVALIAAALAAVAATAFIFYALGYVIVNSHLVRYGVRVSELTNPSFISAGLSFVFFGFLLPASVTGVILWILRPFSRRSTNILQSVSELYSTRTTISYTLGFAFVIGMGTWLIAFIILCIVNGSPPANAPLSFTTYTVCAGIGCALFFALAIWGLIKIPAGAQRLKILVFGPLIASFAFAAIFLWSSTVYPDLTPAVGGGQTIAIQFSVLDPANETQFRAIGVGVDSNLHLTEPLFFLVDTSDALIVRLKDDSAVRIDKKLVTNIRYMYPIVTSTSQFTTTLPISTMSAPSLPAQITPTPKTNKVLR